MTIEGIPDGWELVRIGTPEHEEVIMLTDGSIEMHHEGRNVRMNKNYVIIRKIEKPKQYRPFANAAEFAPHRDRWWKKTTGENRTYPPCYYNDSYYGGLHFDRCFVDRIFDDGTPFGVEVQS